MSELSLALYNPQLHQFFAKKIQNPSWPSAEIALKEQERGQVMCWNLPYTLSDTYMKCPGQKIAKTNRQEAYALKFPQKIPLKSQKEPWVRKG